MSAEVLLWVCIAGLACTPKFICEVCTVSFQKCVGILWIPKVICERWECIVSESAAGILWIPKLIFGRTKL